jgi:hypothetical protein
MVSAEWELAEPYLAYFSCNGDGFSLSLSLSLELLLSFQRKVKFLPFAGIYSTPSSEASPLVIPVAKEKVVLCCGLCPEFRSGFVS